MTNYVVQMKEKEDLEWDHHAFCDTQEEAKEALEEILSCNTNHFEYRIIQMEV